MGQKFRPVFLRYQSRCAQPHCRRSLVGSRSAKHLAWRRYRAEPRGAAPDPENVQPVCTACLDGLKRFLGCPGALACAIARHDPVEAARRVNPRVIRAPARTKGGANVPAL